MSGLPRAAAAAAAAVGAALLLAACGSTTTPNASGASSAAAPTSSAASPAQSSAAPETSSAAPTGEATDNGMADKSAQEILDAALVAAKAQTSVRVQASTTGEEGFDFDLRITKGEGGYGTLSANGTTLDIVVTTDTVYIKADAAFWEETAGPEAAEVIGDKWLSQSSSGSSFSDVAELTDLDQVVEDLLKPESEVTKGEVGEAEGQPAVALNSKDGTLWVATTGEPLPLLIEEKAGEGTASFTEWSVPVEVPVPPADQVVSEDDLPMPSVS